MRYPRSNARTFFRTERCPACGSSNIDWRSDDRQCADCGNRPVAGAANHQQDVPDSTRARTTIGDPDNLWGR